MATLPKKLYYIAYDDPNGKTHVMGKSTGGPYLRLNDAMSRYRGFKSAVKPRVLAVQCEWVSITDDPAGWAAVVILPPQSTWDPVTGRRVANLCRSEYKTVPLMARS